MTYTEIYSSPIGNITMESNKTALTGLWLDSQKYFNGALPPAKTTENIPVLRQTKEWLDIYFSGNKPDFMPPLSFNTTTFRRRVWELLLDIPYGETTTYGEIARIIAKEKGLTKMSAQAVGNAVGHNPISVIVPCHRVVGTDGNLTGYAGGIDKKIFLLKLEKADMSSFYIPQKGTAL